MATEQFRPRSGKIMAIVLYSISGVGLFLAIVSGLALSDILLSIPMLALLAYCGYWLFWFPVLRISTEGATVVNPARTIFVPWSRLSSLQTKYSLTLLTDSGKYSAWAAPAPSPASRKSTETKPVLGVRAAWSAARKRSGANEGRETVDARLNYWQLGIPLGLIIILIFGIFFAR